MTSQRNRRPRPSAIYKESVWVNGNPHPHPSDIRRTHAARELSCLELPAPCTPRMSAGARPGSRRATRQKPLIFFPVPSQGATERPIPQLPSVLDALRSRGGPVATTGRPRGFISDSLGPPSNQAKVRLEGSTGCPPFQSLRPGKSPPFEAPGKEDVSNVDRGAFDQLSARRPTLCMRTWP